MNSVTKGIEVPDNDQMIFSKRETYLHNSLSYEIVVKSSKMPLIKVPTQDVRIHTTIQILNEQGEEVFHDLYPNIFTQEKGDKAIASIKEDIERFING